jgi:hypothetical protein
MKSTGTFTQAVEARVFTMFPAVLGAFVVWRVVTVLAMSAHTFIIHQ